MLYLVVHFKLLVTSIVTIFTGDNYKLVTQSIFHLCALWGKFKL